MSYGIKWPQPLARGLMAPRLDEAPATHEAGGGTIDMGIVGADHDRSPKNSDAKDKESEHAKYDPEHQGPSFPNEKTAPGLWGSVVGRPLRLWPCGRRRAALKVGPHLPSHKINTEALVNSTYTMCQIASHRFSSTMTSSSHRATRHDPRCR